MTLDLIGYNICMHVVLEWIKWYSECFNLQAAIDGMATNVQLVEKNTGWRGGSTTTTENSPPMTQVSPIWMNIQWPWHWTLYSCCSMLCYSVQFVNWMMKLRHFIHTALLSTASFTTLNLIIKHPFSSSSETNQDGEWHCSHPVWR